MKLFKKAKGTTADDKPIVSQLRETLTAIAHKLADYLQHKTKHWSARQVKIALFLFCLLTGNCCLFILGKAVLSANGPPRIVPVSGLPYPRSKKSKRDSIKNKIHEPIKIDNNEKPAN